MTGPSRLRQMLEPADLELHEDARERQNPRRQADAPQEPRDARAIPGRKGDRLCRTRPTSGCVTRRTVIRDRETPTRQDLRARDQRALRSPIVFASASADFIERDLKRFFERHHQLDAIERAQAELVERRLRRELRARRRIARRRPRPSCRGRPRRARRAASPAAHRCSSWRLSFCVPSVRGSAVARPDATCSTRAGDPRASRSRRGRSRRRRRRDRATSTAWMRSSPLDAQSDDAGVLDARLREERALDVLGEDVQSLRRRRSFPSCGP